jgi:Haem-binding domain
MSPVIKILIAIAIILIAMQFVQPALNESAQVLSTDISKTVSISDSVQVILKNACYDCHSNNTNYPWYSNIQPVGWLLANHIKQGKKELNFSEYGNYSSRRQLSKMNGIANNVKDNIMPLSSYKLMHKNAQLSTNQKALLFDWVQLSKDILSAKN